MGAFSDLLAQFDPDPRLRGKQFERVCKWFLCNDPTYKSTLRRVWLWDEWSGRWGADAGIDLVAEDQEGRLWAIQSKGYAPENAVTKADVDKFLAESSRSLFSYRLLIATTDKLHHVARRTINDQEKQVAFVGLSDLLTSEVNWPTSPLDLRPSPPQKPAKPREHQREAIRDVVKGFTKSDRGQLIMACGTGKTLTSLFIKEKLAAERTLVLVPSLSLLKQTMQAWTVNRMVPFQPLPVCSDQTVRASDDDAAVAHTSELGVPVTTDPLDIAAFLRRQSGPRVVFSTYQSSPQIAAAFALGRVPMFDLVIADEAHRVAGVESSDFATVLDETAISTRRRLFMTATPRYFTGRVLKAAQEADLEIASMDDHSKFGTVFHRLTFSEAITRNLLTDYQVAVVGVDNDTYREWADKGTLVTRDGKKITDARTLAGQIGLAKAVRKYDLRRSISFHSRVARAREFAAEMPEVIAWMPTRQRPSGAMWARHASGEMSAGERHVLLQHLSQLDEAERGLLTNARCLSEGVDVPTLDGVAFIDPRRSEVDIVQAVGRAIRKSEGKTVGTIVIPVFIDTDTDPEVALNDSSFKPVWDVIQALRAHDEELGKHLDSLRREMGRTGGVPKLPDKIHLDLPVKVETGFADAFDLRMVELTTRGWEFWFGLLEKYVAQTGTARVPQAFTMDGCRLGAWVREQRGLYADGVLDNSRRQRLDALTGWSWNAREDNWEDGYEHLLGYVSIHGDARVPKTCVFNGFPLGKWVSRQRVWRSKGTLSSERQNQLSALSGWSWDRNSGAWEEGYDSLQVYIREHGDSRVPQSYEHDSYRLGAWVGQQRTLYAKGTLNPQRRRLLEQMPGWVWDINAERWDEFFELLAAHVRKHGDALVPQTWMVDGYNLGQWVSVQRSAYAKGSLEQDRVERLQKINGWSWNARAYRWEMTYKVLCEYVKEHGNARVPHKHQVNGVKLGQWVLEQRGAFKRGVLSADRRERLAKLPGWAWNTQDEQWDNGFERTVRFVEKHGHARVPVAYVDDDDFQLGGWVANQRRKNARNRLTDERSVRLAKLPGWTWKARVTDA